MYNFFIFELQELKRHILEECLTLIVTSFVIPDSGWDKRDIEPVRWTLCFRNATGKRINLNHYIIILVY
jgi:hypothetical protein